MYLETSGHVQADRGLDTESMPESSMDLEASGHVQAEAQNQKVHFGQTKVNSNGSEA